MFSLETTLLGVALALDAAIACFAIGIINTDLPRAQKTSRGLFACALFSLFQSLMIWLGSLGGYFLSFSKYGYLFQLVVILVFFAIGMGVLQKSFKKDDGAIEWGLAPVLILAFATSIDALASGVSMGTLPLVYLIAIEIGVITFFICWLSILSTKHLESLPTKWLLRLAACIFFFLSGRILISYYL